jgi:hypothetical protein
MFLARDGFANREKYVRSFLRSEPSIALVLAAVNFEWTVSRAALFLSRRKNSDLRKIMRSYYAPERYKELWKQEVQPTGIPPLPTIVQNWADVRRGFEARNVLVHGKDRYTTNMASPHVTQLLKGVEFIENYCANVGKPLHDRMPVRRK